jgi:hypothetical protein
MPPDEDWPTTDCESVPWCGFPIKDRHNVALDFLMSEPRSLIVHQRHLEASQKFDYFITGLTGALCAYMTQN